MANLCICISATLTSRINISLKRPKKCYSDNYGFSWDINSKKKLIIVSVKLMFRTCTLFQKKTYNCVQPWTNCAPDADRAHKSSKKRPIFWVRTFCLAKKKNWFDLQISSQIENTTITLHWIPNIIVKILLLKFKQRFLSDSK